MQYLRKFENNDNNLEGCTGSLDEKMRGRKFHVTIPLSLWHCGDIFSQQADDDLVLGTTCCQEVQKTKKISVQYDLFWKEQRLCGVRTSILLFCGELSQALELTGQTLLSVRELITQGSNLFAI
jgi:hypothetical protein